MSAYLGLFLSLDQLAHLLPTAFHFLYSNHLELIITTFFTLRSIHHLLPTVFPYQPLIALHSFPATAPRHIARCSQHSA